MSVSILWTPRNMSFDVVACSISPSETTTRWPGSQPGSQRSPRGRATTSRRAPPPPRHDACRRPQPDPSLPFPPPTSSTSATSIRTIRRSPTAPGQLAAWSTRATVRSICWASEVAPAGWPACPPAVRVAELHARSRTRSVRPATIVAARCIGRSIPRARSTAVGPLSGLCAAGPVFGAAWTVATAWWMPWSSPYPATSMRKNRATSATRTRLPTTAGTLPSSRRTA